MRIPILALALTAAGAFACQNHKHDKPTASAETATSAKGQKAAPAAQAAAEKKAAKTQKPVKG